MESSLSAVAVRKGAMKQTVVVYPSTPVGRVGPMVKLANVFLNHGYDATVLLAEPCGYGATSIERTAVHRIVATNPSITFHVLPPPSFSTAASPGSTTHPVLALLHLLRQYNEPLGAFLRSMPRRCLHSVVLDMFCVDAIDVVAAAGVPVYTFFTSSASGFSTLTQFPALIAGRQTGLKDLGDKPLDLLGLPGMPASHFIEEMLEHPEEDEVCNALTEVWRRNTDTMGVLLNTFEMLESRAVRSLRDPARKLPPVYCVGPLLAGTNDDHKGKVCKDECVAWLDTQPDDSVVFLCFGSMGTLSAKQLREIAVGLERSGQRFMLCVRAPPPTVNPKECSHLDLDWLPPEGFLERTKDKGSSGVVDTKDNTVLPDGFLERTKNKGMVVKSWAPQVEVLRHRATGAFVTHCGWNSVLEAMAAGVPMLCWPLYAEQKMNKVWMTERDGMGVAMELEGYRNGFITAEEVEAKVRLAMAEGEEGVTQLRSRLRSLKGEAEAALAKGGSSSAAFAKFVLDVEDVAVALTE